MKRITKKLAVALLIPVFVLITGMTSFADTAKSSAKTNQCQTRQEEVKKETQTDKSIVPAKASDSISKTDSIKDSQTDNDAKTQSDKSSSDVQKNGNSSEIQKNSSGEKTKNDKSNAEILNEKIPSIEKSTNLKSDDSDSEQSDDIEIVCIPDKKIVKAGDVVNCIINITNKYNIWNSSKTLYCVEASSQDLVFSNDQHSVDINPIGEGETETIYAKYTVPNKNEGEQIQTNIRVDAVYDEWFEDIYNTNTCILQVSPNTLSQESIKIAKSATKVGDCRIYEVGLSVKGLQIGSGCDVAVVIDRSGSMADGGTLNTVKASVSSFVHNVLNNNGKKDNQIALIDFSDNAKIETIGNGTFSSSENAINDAIYKLRAYGGTNLQDAFLKASEALNNGRPFAKKVIVLFSDGSPTFYNGHYDGPNYPIKPNENTEAAIAAAKDAQKIANVFTVGYFESLPNEAVKNFAAIVLKDCAQQGNSFNVHSIKDISDLYNTISNTIDYSARDVVVEDILDEDIIGRFDIIEYPNLNPSSCFSASQGTVSYDKEKGKITWNMGTIMPDQEVTLKYRIKANSNYKETAEQTLNTNQYANINYTNPYNEQKSDAFNRPTITVPPIINVYFEPAEISTNYLDSVDLGKYLNVSGGCYEGCYTYSWSKNENDWTSTDESPVVPPEKYKADNDGNYVFTVTVTNKCGEKGTASFTVKKGKIVINKVLEDKDGHEISINDPRAAKGFEVDVNGQGSESDYINSWNTFMKSGESKTFGNIKIGNYKISEPYVPHGYKAVSMEVDYGSNNKKTVDIAPGAAADSISADIDLKNNPNVTVTITNQVTDDPWFTGEDIRDNNFDTAGTIPGPSCSADLLDKIIVFDWKEDVNGNDSEKM